VRPNDLVELIPEYNVFTVIADRDFYKVHIIDEVGF
jgi:hypothetical protein